ncbi:MAG: hypothetical protein ACEPOV_14230 [Hyphomicrobiales bacterium]
MSGNNNFFFSNNPLYAVEIGSTIESTLGKFKPTVLSANISKMIPDKEVKKSMTGESSFVYTDQLNQGSLGVSGSYGVSGVSKVDSSVSAYVGNSSANSSKTVQVNYNVQMLSGVEYIDFDDLQVCDVINSLKGGPKQDIMTVLDAFNAVAKRIKELGLDINNIAQIIESKDKELQDLLKVWVESSIEFTTANGDGLVVGVIWGGRGMVSMNLTNTQSQNSWKYGGSASFSYSGIGTSVSVEATYNGSQSTQESKVSVDCKSWASGGCVQDQVDKWFDVVSGKSFSEIADIKLLDRAPSIGDVKPPPAIPSFQKPKSDPSVSDKVGEIKDLEGLKTYAIASAYDQAKKDNKDLTLDQFLKTSDKKVDNSNTEKIQQDIKDNNINTIKNKVNIKAEFFAADDVKIPLERSEDKKDDSYTVLGAWITNWSDLFPWLANGYLNQIVDTDSIQEVLKKQCMIQDFIALSRLYYILDNCSMDLTHIGISSPVQIADSFSHNLAYLKTNINDDNVLDAAYNRLNTEAQGIYDKWNEIKFLRGAELGLGVMADGYSIEKFTGIETIPVKAVYSTSKCLFNPKNKNFDSFSKFYKILPLIAPSGDIYAFGPTNMLLFEIDTDNNKAYFTNNAVMATKFKVVEVDGISTLQSGSIRLFPVPVSAAQGVSSWKGQNLSINLSSIKQLNEKFELLNKELSELNIYSFSSSNWKSSWTPEDYYSLRSIRTQYIGMVEQIGSPFSNISKMKKKETADLM